MERVTGDAFDPDVSNKETLMKRREHSMEQAKAQGGGKLMFFSSEIEEKHRRIHEISKALEDSIANDFKFYISQSFL